MQALCALLEAVSDRPHHPPCQAPQQHPTPVHETSMMLLQVHRDCPIVTCTLVLYRCWPSDLTVYLPENGPEGGHELTSHQQRWGGGQTTPQTVQGSAAGKRAEQPCQATACWAGCHGGPASLWSGAIKQQECAGCVGLRWVRPFKLRSDLFCCFGSMQAIWA